MLSRTMEGDYHGQRWTRWCLWKEGALAADIHRRLASMCAEAAQSCKTVFQWVKSFNSGHETVKKVAVQVARQQPICHQLWSVSPSSSRTKNA